MNRRSAIKRVSLLVGGTLSVGYLSTILTGCQADTTTAAGEWVGEFFDNNQIELISNIANTIIPTTDTPGAKEAMVERTIDAAFAHAIDEESQKMFVAGLAQFDKDAGGFNDKSDEDKLAFVKGELKKAAAAAKDTPNFIAAMRQMTCAAFFRSEAGMTKVLQYVDVPGEWVGCLPVEEVGRTWAT